MIASSYNIKVYKINREFYELRNLSSKEEVITYIIERHKEKVDAEFISEVKSNIKEHYIAKWDLNFTIYYFDEYEKESEWKKFLPNQLTEGHDFRLKSSSFCLFTEVDEHIFALIGGKGSSVIKRYQNQSFGIDFYEFIADPVNDIVYKQESRSVSGNLTSESTTYRRDQRLQDVLSVGRVPKSLNLLLRKDLMNKEFSFIDFDTDENIYLELSSSFCIKSKVDFIDTCELLFTMGQIIDNYPKKPLSRFEKIQDEKFCEDSLQIALYDHLRADMVYLRSNKSDARLLDYDFVHPSKLVPFYECDEYKVFEKNHHNPFYETRDRTTIYFEVLRFAYGLIGDSDEWGFYKWIAGVRVLGYKSGQEKTKATFIHHLTCEIAFKRNPFFLIDDTWYRVRGDFITDVNNECAQLMNAQELKPNPLSIEWDVDYMDEGDYNLEYLEKDGFLVLDKMLGHNVELCDLLYEDDSTVYLVHVKGGFDAKIRDVTNQVLVSATRLWNDLKSDSAFLKAVYRRFSGSENNLYNISEEDFLRKFKKEIIYVIAFATNKPNSKVAENIDRFKSNIAKFSLIQSFREMPANYYPLRIVELDNLCF